MGTIGMHGAQWRTVMQLPPLPSTSCIVGNRTRQDVSMFVCFFALRRMRW
jgi:hypothetical protein